MRFLDTTADSRDVILDALHGRNSEDQSRFDHAAAGIIADVRARGIDAVLEQTRAFDWPDADVDGLAIPQHACATAAAALDPTLRGALELAADRIQRYHEAEKAHIQSWELIAQGGAPAVRLGQLIQPVDRAGIYVPGGKAAYPSTVLMAAIPAIVAGVREVIVCTPPDATGAVPATVLAALHIAGVNRSFRVGGAQAIAAMAYGADPVPQVDVIAGPGSAFVNSAKRLVYGQVGIDMLAGPSEVAIIADETTPPDLAAADLLAQTEHGPGNRGIVFSNSAATLQAIASQVEEQRAQLSRREILEQNADALTFITCSSLAECAELSSALAPEHLELFVQNPHALLPLIKNAGAILLGHYTSAPLGDYMAGPSHTLPTAGTARFSSPLSVNTFLKRTSVIEYTADAAAAAAGLTAAFANAEGFDGHAQAALRRSKDTNES